MKSVAATPRPMNIFFFMICEGFVKVKYTAKITETNKPIFYCLIDEILTF